MIYNPRMHASSLLYDGRIKAYNALFDFTIGEYLTAIRSVVEKNQYQRKRVPSSKSIYSLLKQDIVKGCVIPPIVLALMRQEIPRDLNPETATQIVANHTSDLLILDGLQRTYTFLDLERELRGDELSSFRALPIRVEIYMGLDRLGILYRMLTLNTGQTPMSLRQQIEMLYLDYLDHSMDDGVTFVREVDEMHATYLLEFNFKDTIEGFNSYLDRNELPIEREQLLDNIKSLENLSHEGSSKDLFKEFVLAWKAFLMNAQRACQHEQLLPDDADGVDVSWGKSAPQVFKKAQVLTGFGSALGRLKDNKLIDEIRDVNGLVANIVLGKTTPTEFLVDMNKAMQWVKTNTKKIGSAQRLFFHYYFRELLNHESDSYLDLHASIGAAQHKLQSQLL